MALSGERETGGGDKKSTSHHERLISKKTLDDMGIIYSQCHRWSAMANLLKVCYNILMTFSEALQIYRASKTKAEERKNWRQVIKVMPDVESDRYWFRAWDAMERFVGRWPDSEKEKRQAAEDFRNLPDYPGPLPSKKGEVQAVFFSKKS